MDEMINQLAQQMKNDPSMIRNLMQSRDGQLLMHMLTRRDNGKALQQAIYTATRGDTTDMANLVQQMMNSPEGADLVRRIQNKLSK
jgi:ribonuclease D